MIYLLRTVGLTPGGTSTVHIYRGVDKSLARPGRKEATPVKSVMGRGMD